MTNEEFNFALAKCEGELDFAALAKQLGFKDQRLTDIIREAYWRGYDRSTKNALKAIEKSVARTEK